MVSIGARFFQLPEFCEDGLGPTFHMVYIFIATAECVFGEVASKYSNLCGLGSETLSMIQAIVNADLDDLAKLAGRDFIQSRPYKVINNFHFYLRFRNQL
jgi:hypothetical protein